MRVLVVVDMQNDFIDGALGTKEAQKIVKEVAQTIQNFEGRIIYTKDTHEENYLSTQEGKNLPVKHCIRGTFGWEISKEIPVVTGSVILEKPTFGSIALKDQLFQMQEEEPIEEILFVGLCTDICVISNVMLAKAALPEVSIKVKASCCAGVSVASHNNALEAMKMCQIEIA